MADPELNDSIHGYRSSTPRTLTEDEHRCLYSSEQQDRQQVSVFKQNQFDKNAQKHWDQFYKRNTSNFFKDRHWTLREFQISLDGNVKLFEVGCGVGNFLFPLLAELPNLSIVACDFSSTAIDLLRQNANYDSHRIQSFVCDLADDNDLPLEENSMDICSMIFVLSAIHPEKMAHVLRKIHRVNLSRFTQNSELASMTISGAETRRASSLPRLRPVRPRHASVCPTTAAQTLRELLRTTRWHASLFLLH